MCVCSSWGSAEPRRAADAYLRSISRAWRHIWQAVGGAQLSTCCTVNIPFLRARTQAEDGVEQVEHAVALDALALAGGVVGEGLRGGGVSSSFHQSHCCCRRTNLDQVGEQHEAEGALHARALRSKKACVRRRGGVRIC